jgi:hypothetical protein
MAGRRHRVDRTVALTASPDYPVIDRLATLRGTIGEQLGGRNTNVVGVDRGDPTRSLTGPVRAVVSPTNAIAAVTAGTGAGYRPPQTIQDTALTDPNLDPYNGLLLARMRRPAR